jgi:DNA helicase-2/ATP-dependent DNA helicase PcrA
MNINNPVSNDDYKEALQWFVNNCGLYTGSTRGLFLSDWGDDQEALLETAIINLKSRGFSPLIINGASIYQQAEFLWSESANKTTYGRPVVSKIEIEANGADILIVNGIEAPESYKQLWYLYCHLLYPRALAGKPTVITTPISYSEFVRYGHSVVDPEFLGKSINWEKVVSLIEATMVNLELFALQKEEDIPAMLKAEYYLYIALKEKGLNPIPQHVLGDYSLDFALFDKERKLNIECDGISALGGHNIQTQEAKRNLVLLTDTWQILKFTTAEILANKNACADTVYEVWQTGKKRFLPGRLLSGKRIAPMPDLLVDDQDQVAAISHGGGPVSIIGGAGVGKTTCVIQRAAYLITQDINPESILIISYSNELTKSLKKSLEQVIDKQIAQRINIFSWHDLGQKILKENLSAIKRKPPLKIESNTQKLIQKIYAKIKKDKDVDAAQLESLQELDEFYIAAMISMYKSHLILADDALKDAKDDTEKLVAKIYQGLEDQLQRSNRIDRDDIITLATRVLVDNPEIRLKYQLQYEWVLVDEYQDVTAAQDMLARVLASPQDNLFVVGDEDESILESKNACPELLMDISLRIPQMRCYILEKNWRCHPAIVDHASKLIACSQKRHIQKNLVSAWGQAPTGAIIGPKELIDENAEAQWITREIQLLIDSGRQYSEIAVLYRHQAYKDLLEETFNKNSIKCIALTDKIDLCPDEIGDMIAFLQLIDDPDGPKSREAFEKICQIRTKEIDPKLSATIASFAEANNLSYLKAIEIYSEATADQSCKELEQLVRIIRTMNQEKLPPFEAIALLRRTQRLNDYYKSIKVPADVNYEPLKKLTFLEETSRKFKTLPEFLKNYSNKKEGDTESEANTGVQIKNIYDCKGLEFPIVFICGLAENIFPSDNAYDIEEERKLCYVGFTRAKELLYISHPSLFFNKEVKPSVFIADARLLPGAAQAKKTTGVVTKPLPVPVSPPAKKAPPVVQSVATPQKPKAALPPPIPVSIPAVNKANVAAIASNQPVSKPQTQPVKPAMQIKPAAEVRSTPVNKPKAAQQTQIEKCPKCFAKLEEKSQFCGNCGFSLKQIPRCHACGSQMEEKAKFCGECGMSTPSANNINRAIGNSNVLRPNPLSTDQSWMIKLLKFLEK